MTRTMTIANANCIQTDADAFQDDLHAIAPRVWQSGRTGLNDFHAGSQIQCHQFGLINEGRTEADQREDSRPRSRQVSEGPGLHCES
jgi:hypothetical protein